MPHPDDEAIFMGGLLSTLSSHHIPTRVITMTSGEKSTLRYGLKPQDNLSEIRTKELSLALTILGISDYSILNFPDGGLEKKEKEISQKIAQEIKKTNATHIICLEPDGVYGHPDHIALTSYVQIVSKVPIMYATVSPHYTLPSASWMAKKAIHPITPDVKFRLSKNAILGKLRALRAHKSQFMSPLYRLPFELSFFIKNDMLTHEFYAWRH
jgi:LmbE family N-acetylglucosaminyl deacetylase